MNRVITLFVRTAALFAMVMWAATSYGADGSSLKPPPGARVAIVVFEDLECPDCARAFPLLQEAGKKHSIPVVLRDFPLSAHPWSFDAAVFARYFDTKSEKLGVDFRGYIFQNQPQITKQNLRQYADKFANDNKSPLPFVVDPEGKLKEKIIADRDLGTQIGLQHTPTIFVIGNAGAATPAVEVEDRTQIDQIIEDMQKKAAAAAPAKTPAKKGAAKKPTK
ncbi:MAG TPA: thioredoxin domain-containing protein [Candidatus Angelobacter sp.]|nr:thioredoxin domain-containing protein [Candidatus Angelobacter sp.]